MGVLVNPYVLGSNPGAGSYLTGGTQTQDGSFTVLTITDDDELTLVGDGPVVCEALAIGGGGGGGGRLLGGGGGGGAGGYRQTFISVTESIPVTIGTGGAGDTVGGQGSNGTKTSIGTLLEAEGGGGGGGTNGTVGRNGGSGGGGGASSSGAAPWTIPSTLQADVETELWPGLSGDDADDLTIYYHEADPTQSWIIGVSKSEGSDGGLHTFDIDGNLIDSWLVGKINNVDHRDMAEFDNVAAGWDDRVLVLGSDRTIEALRFGWLNRSTGEITSAGTRSLPFEPYGCCLHISPVNGKVYAFASGTGTDRGDLRQYELTVSGNTVSGAVQGRQLDTATLSEGMVCHDETQRLFVGEEDRGLYVYDADPAGSTSRQTIDTVSGRLTADVEGVTIVNATASEPGYIIASSQGASNFQIYNLDTYAYIATFDVSSGAVDGVTDTDGIDVLRRPFGSTWPNGLFIVHDNANPTGSNWKFLDLGELLGPIEGGGGTGEDEAAFGGTGITGGNGGNAYSAASVANSAGGGGGGTDGDGAEATEGMGGNGGPGKSSVITGVAVKRGGGGGGAGNIGGNGGAGGGGAAGKNANGNNGVDGTGSGGGAGSGSSGSRNGGRGGKGIAILRFLTP